MADNANVIAVLGRNRRAGRWKVAGHTLVVAAFGACYLDLTRAVVDEEDEDISMSVFVLFGSVSFLFPQVSPRQHDSAIRDGVAVVGLCRHAPRRRSHRSRSRRPQLDGPVLTHPSRREANGIPTNTVTPTTSRSKRSRPAARGVGHQRRASGRTGTRHRARGVTRQGLSALCRAKDRDDQGQPVKTRTMSALLTTDVGLSVSCEPLAE
jgi:hypothetical protein